MEQGESTRKSFYSGFHRKGKSRQGKQAEDWFIGIISAGSWV